MRFDRALSFALLAAICPPGAWAGEFTLRGIDVYGTQAVTVEQVEGRFGADVRELLRLREARGKSSGKAAAEIDAKAASLKNSIESGIAKMGDFAWAALDWSEKASSAPAGGRDLYLVVEIVEARDKAARIPFRTLPRSHLKDDSGLVDAWAKYQETGWGLARKGDIPLDRAACPAYYCSWGSATPELKRFEDRFAAEVPAHKAALSGVLREDADAACRANALFLLTYLKDGSEVSTLVSAGLTDPDDKVREAAMRVYTDIVLHAADVPVPLEGLGAALDYPFTDDRTRALGLVLSMADKAPYRTFLIQRALPHVLKLLRMKEPSSHQLAYAALGLLSGETLGERDYDAWEQWAFKARSGDVLGKGSKKKR